MLLCFCCARRWSATPATSETMRELVARRAEVAGHLHDCPPVNGNLAFDHVNQRTGVYASGEWQWLG